MLNDSISLVEGSSITNLVVESGDSFPTNPTVGEMFYYTVDSLMYVSNGVTWTSTGVGVGGGGSVLFLVWLLVVATVLRLVAHQ